MILAALVLAADLRLELVRHSLTGSHCRYREYVQGLPTDQFVVKPCAEPSALATNELTELPSGMRIVAGRRAVRTIRDRIAYDYDGETGQLLRTIPLFFRGKPANVFDPNPVASLNDPALQDRNDAASAVPDAAYRMVELPDVMANGPLRGPNVAIIDRQAPNTPPVDGGASLVVERDADAFEDVNAYFHVDRNQRYLQSLGYAGDRAVAAYPIEIDTHAGAGSDNSLFLPSLTQVGRGTLAFGEGGTDDAEDADLLIHEYGHAILEWISPGSFAGSFSSQARALAEGFGDYWAFSQHEAIRRASGRDPFCFADWDARCANDDPSQQCGYPPGSDCLRRLDSPKTMADYDTHEQSGVEHQNGSIWSSALRDLHDRVGKMVADTLVIESIFDLPPLPAFSANARRIVEADEQLYGGAHLLEICDVMRARGILADCELMPRGELTHLQSPARNVTIPDNDTTGMTSTLIVNDSRTIDALFVHVDIAHPSRGDLRIELIAPDGTSVLLKQTSIEGGSGIRTTFGLTSESAQSLAIFHGRPAAGAWTLRVTDLRPRDAGVLRAWALVVRFAGSVRAAMRPRNTHAQMIPVVAHLFGIGATEFVSDVRIANPHDEEVTATLIFTPDGEDGRETFSAIDVALSPGQTVAFDDVLPSAFLTAGTGSLEVLGNVIAMSRTYAITRKGTVGQQVPPGLETTASGEVALYAGALPETGDRLNFGITETAGGSGIVRVGSDDYSILPYGHLQFPTATEVAMVSVISGNARVVAYYSQVDNATSDAMFIPAVHPANRPRSMVPAISAFGASGVRWRTDLWSIVPQPAFPFLIDLTYFIGTQRVSFVGDPARSIDVVANGFQSPGTAGAIFASIPAEMIAYTRIAADGMSQFVPFGSVNGPEEKQLVFIETTNGFRTNIGIVSDTEAVAEWVAFDAGGIERQRGVLSTNGGLAQAAITAPLAAGRVRVRFLSGRGRAYASLVDNGTADATFVEGQ